MATHSSIPMDGRIPWTKPGELKLIGSQTARRNRSNLARMHTYMYLSGIKERDD